jgi:hypothetical protein
MPSAIVYVVMMENHNPMPNLNPVFSPSIPFVSINGQGNPPQLAVPGGAGWFMGVQQGTVITVSAPGFASTVVDTFAPGIPFVGTNRETPIQANLLPLSTGGAGIVLTGGQGWESIPVALSYGDGTFKVVLATSGQAAEFAGWAATPGAQVLTGDFNGDGNTDIALTGVAGWASIPVAFSDGDGTFNATNENSRFAGWASSAGAKVLTGDFNGDGNTDIALTGAAEFPVSYLSPRGF